jgi:hypothetical protein
MLTWGERKVPNHSNSVFKMLCTNSSSFSMRTSSLFKSSKLWSIHPAFGCCERSNAALAQCGKRTRRASGMYIWPAAPVVCIGVLYFASDLQLAHSHLMHLYIYIVNAVVWSDSEFAKLPLQNRCFIVYKLRLIVWIRGCILVWPSCPQPSTADLVLYFLLPMGGCQWRDSAWST